MPTVASRQDVIDVLNTLPTDKIQDAYEALLHLRQVSAPGNYSDEWSDEDLREWTQAGKRRFAQENPDEDDD